MGDGRFEKLKGETLDMLCSVGGIWMEFDELAAEHLQCDGELDEVALRDVLVDLVLEGSVERNDDDEYRWAPKEGESLAEKVKRLEAALETSEAERLRLLGQLRTCGTAGEYVDIAAALAKSVLECAGIRAEQAADRAAVRALVEALPKCWATGCVQPATTCYPPHEDESCDAHDVAGRCRAHDNWYAAPLRALQARMATWPSEADATRPSQRADGIVGTWSDAPVWPQSIQFLRSEDPTTGELLYQRLPSPRFVGEFGDIDEPSVGDVDGYGRRG